MVKLTFVSRHHKPGTVLVLSCIFMSFLEQSLFKWRRQRLRLSNLPMVTLLLGGNQSVTDSQVESFLALGWIGSSLCYLPHPKQ